MSGDPVDPITFERATRELWDRLASNAGVDLEEYLLGSADDQAVGASQSGADRPEHEDQLQALRIEARDRLLGLIIVEELRIWTADGENWKRPTPQGLRDKILQADDESWGLYVDRKELAAVAVARWPEEFMSFGMSAMPLSRSVKRKTERRGRPPGSGSYADDDIPLLIEMEELLKTGKALSPHAASMIVAERARGGGQLESKAKRLRDGYAATRQKGA